MKELIERLKSARAIAEKTGIAGVSWVVLNDTIAALQPVDDEEAKKVLNDLRPYVECLNDDLDDEWIENAFNLITRLHNQNRELEKINTLLLAEHKAGRKISRLSSNDSWEKWVDACDACCEIEAMSTTGEEL